MSAPGATVASDLVPLADRLRYMQLFRLALAATVMVAGYAASDTLGTPLHILAVGTGVFAIVSLVGEVAWRLSRRRGITLFGGMLIADGFYLAWLTYVTGALVSPLRYLIVLHLIAVALLASYRTGLKLAMWHSLLLFLTFHAQGSGLLDPMIQAADALPGSNFKRLAMFSTIFWFVAISTAAFSAVNERELRRRRYDLEALASLARDLDHATDSLTVAETIVGHAADAFDFERAVLFGGNNEQLEVLATHGATRATGTSTPAPSDRSVVRQAARSAETQLVSHVIPGDDPTLDALLPQAANLIVMPLTAEGRAIGVLVAEHRLRSESRVERRVVSMLERFASHGSLALRNAWLLEDVQARAATDGLTELPNRRTFDATLAREISRSGRTQEPMSLVMVDIDHFKPLNDEHGHQTGDEVLRRVASVLQVNCRDFDTAARFGGEEFALVLPRCDVAEGAAIAERVRRAVAEGDTLVSVTISAGVATWPAHATDGEDLVAAADEALYRSKREGRDRVTVSHRRALAAVPGLAKTGGAGGGGA